MRQMAPMAVSCTALSRSESKRGANSARRMMCTAKQDAHGEERDGSRLLDSVLYDDECRPEQEGGADQRPVGERRGSTLDAQPVYRLVMGRRRSLPKALCVTRTPGGAWRRLYSARSTRVTTRRTSAGSKPACASSPAVMSSST